MYALLLLVALFLLPYPVPPEAITVQYQGHEHRIFFASLSFGPTIYDSIDGDLPIPVSHTRTVTGALKASAASELWACWSDAFSGRTVVYCGRWNPQADIWESAPIPNVTGDVTYLSALPDQRVILGARDAGYLDCPDTWVIFTWPKVPLPVCGCFGPRQFFPHLVQ